jgi:hypothetical protein
MNKIVFTIFLLSQIVIGSNNLHAQIMEVEGQAKITLMDTVTDVSANVVWQADGTLALRQYKIGDMAQGGIVFFIDESGEHGLVADISDVSTGIRWYAGTSGRTQAKGDGPFAGEMNTAVIIAAHVAIGDDWGIYAARLCAELQKGGYGDWYLPSKEELNLMYNNLYLAGLGGFDTSNNYWCSTEVEGSSSFAWSQWFLTGNQTVGSPKGSTHRVRAIRAF